MAIKKHNYRNCLEYLLYSKKCKLCDESAVFAELSCDEAGEQVTALSKKLSELVWNAAVGICERAEHARLIVGNGHHMAQKLGEMARKEMISRYATADGKPIR
jgi:hypothetical protein